MKNKDFIESYSYGGFAYSPSLKYKARLQKKEPIAAMVLREKFDYGLVKLAIESGADFIDGKTVEDIIISKDKARIILDDKTEINSEIIVGADGIRSIVAKKAGLAPKKKKMGVCVFQEYKVDKKTIDKFFGNERMCHIHMGFQNIFGYGWVFPKKEHINIGIASVSSDYKMNLLNIYKNYFNILKKDGVIPKNLKMGRCKGGILPVSPLEKTYSEKILLIGDAAGFINPASGEGIYFAMSSGEIAAKFICEALEKGDTSEKNLSKYEKIWKNDFGKDIDMLLGSAKNVGKDVDKFVRLASKDKKLADITLSILHGSLSIHEYKLQLICRYIYASLKDLFSIS